MAAFLFLLLLSAFHTISAQQRQLNITLGESLSPNGQNSWPSPSGLFAFGFYQQGEGYAVGIFIAGIPQKTVVWTANRDNPIVSGGSTLLLTTDGKLLLQEGQEQNRSVLGLSNPSDSIATASMLDSGNFVLYNSVQDIIWQSFDHPTNSLLPGQPLQGQEGQELVSSSSETDDSEGIFLLKMQLDGYLVQYPVGTTYGMQYAYWQGKDARGNDFPGLGYRSSLNLDANGHLYVKNSSTTVHIFLGGSDTSKIYVAKVDVDGIFRLYSHSKNQTGNWSEEWETSRDKCQPKGICGPNSYCILQDTEAQCECLPGFDFVNETNKKLGCVRNSAVQSCKQENGIIKYNFVSSENIEWVSTSYAVLGTTTTREECQDACRDDCNCQVVFFDGGNCSMQKLPLIFGRRNLSKSTVALIKMSNSNNDGEGRPPPSIKKEVCPDILIISISVLSVAVLILVISGVLIRKKRVWEYKLIIGESRNAKLMIDHEGPRQFTYAELEKATNDFKEELGKGAFGSVYKGMILDSQKEVAVKRLENNVFAEGAKREFQNEIRMIGKTHHRNLVRLIGFCHEGHQRLLVYEYMSNGSLADHLFEQKDGQLPFSFNERIGIAVDVAKGILYLHQECETHIIHCDIKPQNILMDKNWRARISDYGLAKLLNYDQTKTCTGIRGTKGYVAPEWHRKFPVTVKADVYSYGIVLLEILCCRRSIDLNLPEDEIVLEYFAYSCFEAGELHKLVGDEEVDKRKLERMIKIAIWCIQDEPSLRPSMKKVLLMIEGTVDIPSPPSPTSILSTIN